ncbi:MAG: sporulation protein [Ruminococcus sp.]|nr:sporulation protein [Ruminococcus sp.]
MKKIIMTIFTVLYVLLFFPAGYISVSAQDQQDITAEEINEELSDITDEINGELRDALDEQSEDLWEQQNFSAGDPDSITGIKPQSVFKKLLSYFTDVIKEPVVMLGKILAVSIVYAALKSMYLESGPAERTYGVICVLCIIIVMSDTVSGSFESLRDGIESINRFMTAYIPVFAASAAAGGHAAAAGCYSASTLFVCEGAALVSSKLLLPFLSAVMAVTVVSAVNPRLKFAGVADSVKKLTTWLLATLMIIFVGLMALQGVTGSAADNLTYRTLRFAAASFIPVIGNSVSEAFLAVKGGMGVISSTTGAIGVIVVFVTAVKPFLSLLAIKLCIWLGRISNDLLGITETSEFLRNTNSVLSIGLSILIAFSSAFIISTAVVMASAGGI